VGYDKFSHADARRLTEATHIAAEGLSHILRLVAELSHLTLHNIWEKAYFDMI
jgi:hypothetical protein